MSSASISDWLGELAAKQPTPGGGGVAALHAATSAALIGMVTIYTTGSKWAEHESKMKAFNEEATKLRVHALDLIGDDAKSFAKVGAAYKMPKDNEKQTEARKTAIQDALVSAAEPPSEVVRLSMRLVEICDALVETGNPNVISDVAVAATTAAAALDSAVVNIAINQASITDINTRESLEAVIKQAQEGIVSANKISKSVLDKIRVN